MKLVKTGGHAVTTCSATIWQTLNTNLWNIWQTANKHIPHLDHTFNTCATRFYQQMSEQKKTAKENTSRHNPSHWGLGDQAPRKHGVTTLASGRRRATLGKNAWFIGSTGKAHQEQLVHEQPGQRTPGRPPHQRSTSHQHHHSSRVKPTMVNGTSPAAATAAHRQRKTQYLASAQLLWVVCGNEDAAEEFVFGGGRGARETFRFYLADATSQTEFRFQS